MAKICPDCGSENADVAQFCKGCGKQLETPVIKAEEEPKKRKRPERKPRKERKRKGEKKDYIGDFKEKWSTWSTAKKAGVGIVSFCCLALIVMFLIFSLVPDANTANNEPYTFEGFTLDLPKDCSVSNTTTTDEEDYTVNSYEIHSDKLDYPVTVKVMKGANLVSSAEEFAVNVMDTHPGATTLPSHGQWKTINCTKVNVNGQSVNQGYVMAYHTGDKLVAIVCEDLDLLNEIADTFKEI